MQRDDKHLYQYIIKNGVDLIISFDENEHEIVDIIQRSLGEDKQLVVLNVSYIEIPIANNNSSFKRTKIDFMIDVKLKSATILKCYIYSNSYLKTDEDGNQLEYPQKYSLTLITSANFEFTATINSDCVKLLPKLIYEAYDYRNSNHKRIIIISKYYIQYHKINSLL